METAGPAPAEISTIELLSTNSLDELLIFERENREFFASWVPDRGDDYFAEFVARNTALLAEQRDGASLFFLIRDGTGEVVGRVNVIDIQDGAASLGYRLARTATRRGHAARSVTLALERVAHAGVSRVTAMTTADNVASQRVLERCGFLCVDGVPAQLPVNGVLLNAVHYERTEPTHSVTLAEW